MTYTYNIAACTVQNSWWWTEELSETGGILFQKQIWEISASIWFNIIGIFYDVRSPNAKHALLLFFVLFSTDIATTSDRLQTSWRFNTQWPPCRTQYWPKLISFSATLLYWIQRNFLFHVSLLPVLHMSFSIRGQWNSPNQKLVIYIRCAPTIASLVSGGGMNLRVL